MTNEIVRGGWMVENEYYEWLLEKVMDNPETYERYSLLLDSLFIKPFEWSVANDDNRLADGMNLRRDFNYIFGDSIWTYQLGPCSCLEMMIALSERCELDIMGIPGEEDIGRWFWIMLENLGLLEYDNLHFDGLEVNGILDIWLKREYWPDGTGGVFPNPGSNLDQRKVEIWDQMNAYLVNNYPI